MASKKGHVTVYLDAVDKNLRKGMNGVNKVMRSLKKAIIPATIAVAALAVITKKAVDAANVQILAERKLEHTLIKLNGATKAQVDDLKALASERQKVTTYGDEVTLSAMATLATYKLSTDTIKKLTPTIQDMSAALGVDLKSATELVGKAMTGYHSMLSRYGIILDETTKKILTSGTETEKLAVLNKALEARYKGLAEVVGKTFAGSVALLKNNFGDLLESYGNIIAKSGALQTIVSGTAGEFASWGEWIDSNIPAIEESIKGFAVSTIIAYGAVTSAVAEVTAMFLQMGKVLITVYEATPVGIAHKLFPGESVMSKARKRLDKYSQSLLEVGNNAENAAVRMATLIAKSKAVIGVGPTKGGGGVTPAADAAAAAGKAAAAAALEHQALINEQLGRRIIAQQKIDESLRATADLERILAESSAGLMEERHQEINAQNDAIAEKWIGASTTMADVTRNTIGRAVGEVGSGLARNIVDGTNDWNAALKNVAKTMAALIIKMLAMAAILAAIKVTMAALTGGTTGFGGAFMGALGVGHKGSSDWPKGTQPRRFHSGGILRNNEYPAILEGGEGVINRRAMAQPGMRSLVQSANTGGSAGGGTTIINQYTIYANDAASFQDQMRRSGYQTMEDDVKDGRLFNGLMQAG